MFIDISGSSDESSLKISFRNAIPYTGMGSSEIILLCFEEMSIDSLSGSCVSSLKHIGLNGGHSPTKSQ